MAKHPFDSEVEQLEAVCSNAEEYFKTNKKKFKVAGHKRKHLITLNEVQLITQLSVSQITALMNMGWFPKHHGGLWLAETVNYWDSMAEITEMDRGLRN